MTQSISRTGLDTTFASEESRKSTLLLQAKWTREQGKYDESARLFAETAAIEESLADVSEAQGLVERSHMHRFSAASCWAQAGDFHHALTLCERLLEATDLSDRLRLRVTGYMHVLSQRRSLWYDEVIAQTVG